MKEGPSGSAIRSLIPSHRKLLRSKAVVVSVAETPERRFRQARLREASASKPSMKCRKALNHRSDKSLQELAALYNPCIRGWISYYSHF